MKPGTVYIALRQTSLPGFWRSLFSALTRWRLVTKFPHGGIVVDGRVYHTTLTDGLHAEDFDPEGWVLFPTKFDKQVVLERFSVFEGTPYDWFSLLAFVLPWRVSYGSWLYCYEWVWLGCKGENPIGRITPEDLIGLAAGALNELP